MAVAPSAIDSGTGQAVTVVGPQSELQLIEKDYLRFRDTTGRVNQNRVFSETLPRERSLSRVIKAWTDSLCWANVWVYSPVTIFQRKPVISSKPKFLQRISDPKSPVSSERLLGTYHILTSTNEIHVSHQHTWSGGGLLEGAISSILGLVSKIRSLSEGQLVSTRGSRLNQVSSYQESKMLEVTVPAVLFSFSDPIKDIMLPIANLVTYTYPQRVNDFQEAEADQAKQRVAAEFAGIVAQEGVTADLKKIGTALNLRYYSYISPHYFSLTFSNQAIQIPVAAITNVNVVYKGPWLTRANQNIAPGKKTLLDRIISAVKYIGYQTNTPYGAIAANYFSDWNLVNQQFNKLYSALTSPILTSPPYDNSGYPTVAELEITFTSLEPFFAQDVWQTFSDYRSQTSSNITRKNVEQWQ